MGDAVHGNLRTFVVSYEDGTTEEIKAHRFSQKERAGGVETRFWPFPESAGGEVETIDRYGVTAVEERVRDLLRLAWQQADECGESRIAATIADAISALDAGKPVLCEHASATGSGPLEHDWICDTCGATWPMAPSSGELRGWGTPPPPVRTHVIVADLDARATGEL